MIAEKPGHPLFEVDHLHMSPRPVGELRDRHIQGAELLFEQPLGRQGAIQAPTRLRLARLKEANRPLAENVQLCRPVGPLRSEVDKVLERLPLTHGVASFPTRQLELRDSTVRLQVEWPRLVIACPKRRAGNYLAGPKQCWERERDCRRVNYVADPANSPPDGHRVPEKAGRDTGILEQTADLCLRRALQRLLQIGDAVRQRGSIKELPQRSQRGGKVVTVLHGTRICSQENPETRTRAPTPNPARRLCGKTPHSVKDIEKKVWWLSSLGRRLTVDARVLVRASAKFLPNAAAGLSESGPERL